MTENMELNTNNDLASNQDSILRELNLDKKEPQLESQPPMSRNKSVKMVAVFCLIAVLAGVGTGYAGYKMQSESTGTGPKGSSLQQVAGETVKAGDIFGIKDEKTFKDSAEGFLAVSEGDEEGSHKLLRPGGVSQTVHLTSSSTDLDKFIGMEIKVKGETFKGQKAGWLMDVGQVQVVKVNGEEPTEF